MACKVMSVISRLDTALLRLKHSRYIADQSIVGLRLLEGQVLKQPWLLRADAVVEFAH